MSTVSQEVIPDEEQAQVQEVETIIDEDYEEEYDSEMEEMCRQYDEMLRREAEENPPEIGYCGFPCDGRCPTCGGAGGFDMADEF